MTGFTTGTGEPAVLRRLNVIACMAMIVVGLAAAYGFAFLPSLTTSAAMHLVAGLGIPWKGWACAFLLYSILLTRPGSRFWGFLLGILLIAFWLTSYTYSTLHGGPGSVMGFYSGYLALVSQVNGLVRSVVAEGRRS